jgi:hypothetical protein
MELGEYIAIVGDKWSSHKTKEEAKAHLNSYLGGCFDEYPEPTVIARVEYRQWLSDPDKHLKKVNPVINNETG